VTATDLTGADLWSVGLPPVVSVYQPIVNLDSGSVVAYEALVRGAPGSRLRSPAELFGWARSQGRVVDLDWACRLSAVTGALGNRLPAGSGLFINVEPTVGTGPQADLLDRLAELADATGARLVVEITERRLGDDVARLLRFADEIHARGWALAIDDVGAEPASLALMPFLAPDVIKLDLQLIQARTTVATARIVNAVMAQSQRTGATVLAEGIETPAQQELALSMGAELGQGWLYGRPEPLPSEHVASPISLREWVDRPRPPLSPWELVRSAPSLRRARRPLLDAMSLHLERQVFAGDDATVLLGAFQQAAYFNARTARRYERLAASAFRVAVLAADVGPEPAGGVLGRALGPGDPLLHEWTVVVVSPHFAGALIAHDVGDRGIEAERRFDYVVTFDRDIVLEAAGSMLRRAQPWEGGAGWAHPR
jgi:EAL domain-containing protein (putative c-di-GMP-specific phosphodiesterase class I)